MLLKFYKNQFILLFVIVLGFLNLQAQTNDQHIKVMLRAIGHEFLLQQNDSTSRILPIKKINNRYVVSFEKDFSFEPDLLFKTVYKVLKANKINENFIVEVEKCNANDIIHSFKAGLNKRDIIMPCKLRVLSKDCYTFYFTINENKKFIFHNSPISNTSFNYLKLLPFLLVLGAILFLYFRFKKPKLKSNFIPIGQYKYDKKNMVLIHKEQTETLSSIEGDLLLLLYNNENKSLERDYILKEVWGDQGNYIGRTLDVFISKLRKKLEADSNIKIVNIRGVGYKFVLN